MAVRSRSLWFVLAVGCLALVKTSAAQHLPTGDTFEDYARLLQVGGAGENESSFLSRPQSRAALCEDVARQHPWSGQLPCGRLISWYGLQYGVAPVEGTAYTNSARPFGQNDGAVWQGKGVTTKAALGAAARYRFLSAALRPRLIYTSNGDFELSRLRVRMENSVYAYPLRLDIDWPQRFGDEPWTDVVFDDSYIQAEYRSVAAGISTESMWWGPAMRNPLIMSNNAGGFPHVFLRSNDRIATPIGSIEGRWIWGSLSHTEYFVNTFQWPGTELHEAEEHRRFLTAITLNWNPRWVPGLYVGLGQTLMLHYAQKKLFLRDYLGVINPPFIELPNERAKEGDDKMISFFARWMHPASGFEVYGEWGRGDHTSNFRDIFVEPDHARAWSLGLQKIFKPSDDVWTRLMIETTNLEAPRQSGSRLNRGSAFYVHHKIRQGYTHNGQILGAGIGPGSNGQFLGFDVFAPFGKVGIHGLRWVHDNDRYYVYYLADRRRAWWEHEVELGGGASFLAFLGDFEIGGSATWTRLLNKDYVFKNDESNLNLQFSVRYDVMRIR